MQPPGVANIRDSMQSKQTQGSNYDHQRANSSLGLYPSGAPQGVQGRNFPGNQTNDDPASASALAARQYDDIH